jgi:hypothetical protein
MGADPYYYFVKYDSDINQALQQLRKREFEAGRYYPALSHLSFPIGPHSPSPGPRHASIRQALEASAPDGTQSILDLDHLSDQPALFAAAPLPRAELQGLFGTDRPTREMIEGSAALLATLERGQGIYIVAYRDGRPDEIFFGGCSFD